MGQRGGDMITKCVADWGVPSRQCEGPLAAYIAGFGALLDARGYANATEKPQLHVVADFSRWLAYRQLSA